MEPHDHWHHGDGVIVASRNSSAVDGPEYERVLERVAGAVRGVLGSGRVPDQIPVLASADPYMFGLAVATVEGDVYGLGEWRRRGSHAAMSMGVTTALARQDESVAAPRRMG